MSKELKPIDQLCQSLSAPAFRHNLQQALPANVDVDKFIRTASNAIQTHPQQEKLLKSDRRTLFVACQKAAADGLVLDGREATLVAYWNKTKGLNDIGYVPMVQGLVKTARNSGEVANIYADVVYKNDSFRYRPGMDDEPVFEPDWFADDRGEPVGAYAVITLKSGEKIPAILPKKRIMDIGAGGNNASQYDPSAGKHFGEWWKKTAIKNALKYAPKSAELMNIIENDNREEFPESRATESAQSILEQMRQQPAAAKPKTIEGEYEEYVDESTGEVLEESAPEAVVVAEEAKPEPVPVAAKEQAKPAAAKKKINLVDGIE